MLLLCSFFRLKRIISSEKWFNYVVTFLFFFLKIPKVWLGRTTLNGEKEEDGLIKHDSHDRVNFCRIKLNLSSVSVWYCIKSHSDYPAEYVSVWQGDLQITRLSCRKWLFRDILIHRQWIHTLASHADVLRASSRVPPLIRGAARRNAWEAKHTPTRKELCNHVSLKGKTLNFTSTWRKETQKELTVALHFFLFCRPK